MIKYMHTSGDKENEKKNPRTLRLALCVGLYENLPEHQKVQENMKTIEM